MRHLTHPRTMTALVAGLALTTLTAAAPADDTSGSSEAEAVAAEVDGVVTVGESHADSDGEADATAVAVGDETVSGGSQSGDGEASGELAGTGETDQGSMSVGGWSTSVSGDQADAASSAARAESADGEHGVRVLGSSSSANATGATAESSALELWLGGGSLHLILLGAHTSSAQDGGSYLVDVNGERIVTSDDADGQCVLDLAPLARISCLVAEHVSGTDGTVGEEAEVLGVVLGPDEDGPDGALTGTLVGAESTTTPAPAPEDDADGDDDGDGTEVLDTEVTRDDTVASGTLPRTGGGVGLGLAGLASLVGGVLLRRRG